MNEPTSIKIVPIDRLLSVVEKLKTEGKRIVSTNGCFDILHAGHVETFEWAKRQGDVLVVGINSDLSVRLNKGEKRPIVSERDRARLLAGLASIDYIYLFSEKSPLESLAKLRPHVHVKGQGSELSSAFTAELDRITEGGGIVLLAPKIEGYSTTGIIEAVLTKYR